MERSSFFNAVLDQSGTPDRAYLAEDFAKYFSSFIGNGVFPNPANQLQVVAVDNNMQIRLKQGMAWINGYFYVNTDDLILKLEPADGVLSRIDRIILRLDFLNREIKAKVKKGGFASTPVPPTLQRDADAYEIAVSDVNLRNGVIKINQSDIMDTRLNKNVCGIVHGIIEQVDTTEIFRQYQAWFLENKTLHENDFEIWMSEFKTVVGKKFTDWVDDIKNSLDPNEDIAAQLQMQISANKSSLDDKALKSDFDKLGEFKQTPKVISGSNLNNLIIAGNYVGNNLINAPSNEFYRVQVLPSDTGKNYCKQIISKLYDEKETFERVCKNESSDTWTPWFSLFQSVSSMKAKVASATTDMGVPTDATATGDVMAQNIRKINNLPKLTKTFDDIPSQSSGYLAKSIQGITKDYIYRASDIKKQYITHSTAFDKTDFNGTLISSGSFDLGDAGFINYTDDRHYSYDSSNKDTYYVNEYDNNNTKLRSVSIPKFEGRWFTSPRYCYKGKILMTSFSNDISTCHFYNFNGTKLSSPDGTPDFERIIFTAAIPNGRVVMYTNPNSSYYWVNTFDFENNKVAVGQSTMRDGNPTSVMSYMLLAPFLY